MNIYIYSNEQTKNTQETQHVSVYTESMSYNKYRLLSAYRGEGVDGENGERGKRTGERPGGDSAYRRQNRRDVFLQPSTLKG